MTIAARRAALWRVSARPLDQFPGAAAAYSLRQLSALDLDAVRLRRSSDNAEADFKASALTDGTLTTWLGGGDAFVRTWYDQSGSGRHLQQATTGFQPRLIGGVHCLFDGTNDFMQYNGTTPTSPAVSCFVVAKKVTHRTFGGIFSLLPVPLTGNSDFNRLDAGTFNQDTAASNLAFQRTNGMRLAYSGYSLGSYFLASILQRPAFNSLRLDGAAAVTDTASLSLVNSGGIIVGARFEGFVVNHGNLEVKELIIYGSNQAANETAIRDNVNAFHSVF